MRVIIAHTLEQTKAALAAAVECKKPVTLQSAPNAIFYAGALYLLHMFEAAKKAMPDAQAFFIVDCADDAAEAVNAMQMGHMHIRVQSSEFRVQDIAKQYGITVYTEPYEALDLLNSNDVRKDCLNWLQSN